MAGMGLKNKFFASADGWLNDLVAGISISGLLLPEAVAYSSIAGLPPQAGIVALFSGLICYGLIGQSRFAIAAATSSSAVVMAAATSSMAGSDMVLRSTLSIGLILLTGFFFVVAGWTKLGGVSDFIAKPVLRGFAFGLSVVIIIKQLPKIVGISSHQSEFASVIIDLVRQYHQWNTCGILLALLTLVLLFLFASQRYLPGALVVVGLGIVANQHFDLAKYGIKPVGPIQLVLTSHSFPVLEQSQWLRLAELAIAMLLILCAESYGAIQTYAIKHGDATAPNRDLWALGLANMVSGLFHGLPVGAGFSATSANEAAGAKSRLSGLICATAVLVIVITLLPKIADTPEPILAAIVIHAVSHSLSFRGFQLYFHIQRDRLVVLASVLFVLVFGVLDGLLAAVGLSLTLMLRRLSSDKLSVLGRINASHDFASVGLHPDAHEIPGIVILRPEEPLFFANASRVLQAIRQICADRKQVHTIILSMEESPDLDSSTVEALINFANIIEAEKQKLILVRLKDPAKALLQCIPKKKMTNLAFLDLSVDTAVEMAFQNKLHDPEST